MSGWLFKNKSSVSSSDLLQSSLSRLQNEYLGRFSQGVKGLLGWAWRTHFHEMLKLRMMEGCNVIPSCSFMACTWTNILLPLPYFIFKLNKICDCYFIECCYENTTNFTNADWVCKTHCLYIFMINKKCYLIALINQFIILMSASGPVSCNKTKPGTQ